MLKRDAASVQREMPTLLRPGVPAEEYRARRERVLKELDGAAAVLFAGESAGHGGFAGEQHFAYLTGITTESGAAVLFNPSADDPTRRVVLFLRPVDPELDRWERYRETISAGLRAATGFETVMRTTHLPTHLSTAARRCRRLACLHEFATYTGAVTPDLSVYRKIQERTVGVSVEDRSTLLAAHRSVKSAAELALMKSAADATAAGYAAVLRDLRPGALESTVARTLLSSYIDAGADGHAYDPICGTGLNATLLHYKENAAVCREGELLLIDSGARYHGYCCDVTRTVPVSGTFTREQAELYDVVLRAQAAAIRAAKPGAYIYQLDRAAREVLREAGLEDFYIHGIGHQLGLDVHDSTPDGPLKPGMVVTIEPGVYLPDRKIGIRIEDDILVTRSGPKNLTEAIPKSIDAIEKAMAGGARSGKAGGGSAAVTPSRRPAPSRARNGR